MRVTRVKCELERPMMMGLSRLSRLAGMGSLQSNNFWHDMGPLENELASHRQCSPQRRERVQAGDHAFDIRGVFLGKNWRGPPRVGLLPMFASPRDVAELREALRLCQFCCMAR